MKASEIVYGKVYAVKVSGRIQPVRIMSCAVLSNRKQWKGVNVNTHRDVVIRSADKLCYELVRIGQTWRRATLPNKMIACAPVNGTQHWLAREQDVRMSELTSDLLRKAGQS